MSDSGRQAGDCQHGRDPEWCVHCLRDTLSKRRHQLGEVRAAYVEADQEREACRDVLSSLSSWLGQGFGDGSVTADEFEARIRAGVDTIVDVEVRRREHATAERDRLANVIRTHHAQRQDDRCWMDDAALYDAAGIRGPHQPVFTVTNLPAMRRNCDRFLERRCIEGGDWPTYAELEAEIVDLARENAALARALRAAGGDDILAVADIRTEFRGEDGDRL